jgi:hypothetical protein
VGSLPGNVNDPYLHNLGSVVVLPGNSGGFSRCDI